MEITFVTTNPGKLVEARKLAEPFGISVVSNDYDSIELQSDDLLEIAKESAKDAFNLIQKPLIVDDSGVFCEALGGFPGPYSAYIYKTIGVDGVLKLLEGKENKKASMISAVAFTDGKETKTFLGEVKGEIIPEKRGEGGFGFDPIFVPKGNDKTFSEDEEYKDKVSHRAQSIKAFFEWYSTQ